jgi:hypothetical protein
MIPVQGVGIWEIFGSAEAPGQEKCKMSWVIPAANAMYTAQPTPAEAGIERRLSYVEGIYPISSDLPKDVPGDGPLLPAPAGSTFDRPAR